MPMSYMPCAIYNFYDIYNIYAIFAICIYAIYAIDATVWVLAFSAYTLV